MLGSALRYAGTALALLSAGCASLPPLGDTPPPASSLAALRAPSADAAIPGLAPHRLDLSDGLDETEAAMLAIANNPDLRSTRAAAGVAEAQLFAAGLLPDPQLSASVDEPDPRSGGLVSAYSLAAGIDLAALITYGARHDEGRAARAQAQLDLVWAEWQVAQEARVLHRRLLNLAQRLRWLHDDVARYGERQQRTAEALARGDITLDGAAGDLVALLDAQTRLRDAELKNIDAQAAFRSLLGLTPDAPLPALRESTPASPPDAAALAAALQALPQRRPDLRALAAGYTAQDARLRAALLNRLPNLSLSFSRARDTGGVLTSGLGISLSLPFLDGNRGAIRVAEATGAQLRAEYAARLAQTTADARRLWQTAEALRGQINALEQRLPMLEAMTRKAEAGADSRNLDPLAALSLHAQWLAQRLELADRRQQLAETEAALSTLLGLPPEAGWSSAADEMPQ